MEVLTLGVPDMGMAYFTTDVSEVWGVEKINPRWVPYSAEVYVFITKNPASEIRQICFSAWPQRRGGKMIGCLPFFSQIGFACLVVGKNKRHSYQMVVVPW